MCQTNYNRSQHSASVSSAKTKMKAIADYCSIKANATSGGDGGEADAHPKDSQGNEIVVDEVLKAVAEKEESELNLDESCFREVTTKNGTRMVLSLSKTFMKLKDLILEKKSLTEQVEKMKAINVHLSTRVNSHEEKLFNITDELNKTWSFVSTLKQQHRQLHESEQILRAELSEKRKILAKLRKELEDSRESWNVVKQKTADSEREWHALRAEFAARRKLFKSAYHLSRGAGGDGLEDDPESSESGFSTDNMAEVETETETEEADPIKKNDASTTVDTEAAASTSTASALASDDPMTQSTITIKNEEPGIEDPEFQELPANHEGEREIMSILVPPLDFIAQVPPDLFPPLLPKESLLDEKEAGDSAEEEPGNEKYCDLYQKLIASTARSAALANRLAANRLPEMHRTNGIEDGSSEEVEEEDEDYEPKSEEDSIIQGATSPEIVSEITSEVEEPIYLDEAENLEDGLEPEFESDDEELEDLGLSPEAIEQALAASGRHFDDEDDEGDSETEDETSVSLLEESEDSEAASELAMFQAATPRLGHSLSIPEPPPPPTFSLLPPPATVTVRPTYNYANIDSADSSEDEGSNEHDNQDNEEASENATAVTRFLIKHLPKQLSTLRNDKIELEEKIRDLETLLSNQNVAMNEMERRIEVYKKEAETARKWSASLANLHHIKVNTTSLNSLMAEPSSPTALASPTASCTSSESSAVAAPAIGEQESYEWVELPVTVTKAEVKMVWKILCSASNTVGFVAYRPSTASAALAASGDNSALATYILSGISLHSSDHSEIEVKAKKPGLYVLQLRATRFV